MYNKQTKYLLGGRIATNIADSLQYMIILWFFNETFKSPFLLGVIFAIESGADVISFLFGPLIDNSNSKKLLIKCSAVQIINVLILCVINITFGIKSNVIYSIIMVLSLTITTLASTIIYPLQTKMIPMVAGETPLVKVNGIFNVSEKIFDVLFNAGATLLISSFNVSFNLIISLVVFLIGIKLYSLLNYDENFDYSEIEDYEEEGTVGEYIADLKEGFVELRKQNELLKLIIPLMVINFFFAIADIGLPRLASEYISDEATGYGLILSISAIGSIVGGAFTQFKNIEKANLRKMVAMCLISSGIFKLITAITINRIFVLCCISIFFCSAFISFMNILFISLVQSTVPVNILGRVETINESIISAIIPLGTFAGAFVIKEYGSIMTQYIYAVALVGFGVYYALLKVEKYSC